MTISCGVIVGARRAALGLKSKLPFIQRHHINETTLASDKVVIISG